MSDLKQSETDKTVAKIHWLLKRSIIAVFLFIIAYNWESISAEIGDLLR